MAPFSPQALTPRKRQIEKSLEKADSIIRSGGLTINKRTFYGNCKRTRPRYFQDSPSSDETDSKKVDVYEFDENGETPQESQFNHVIKPHEIGFPNPPGTNVCWMNATLQIVLGMKCLVNELESPINGSNVSRNHYSSILQAFLDVVRQHKRGRILPVHKDLSNLRAALASLDSAFACEYQQDAPEFLIRLLDNFREDFYDVGNSEKNNNGETTPLKELKWDNCNSPATPLLKKQKSNPICDNLQFSMKEHYCCTSCGTQNEKTQDHLALYVDIPLEEKEEPTSIATALDEYMKIHTRELRCEKCQGEQCRVNTVFNQLPRFLLIQVKRYTYLEHLTQKITSSIGIPLDINVSRLVDSNITLPKLLQAVNEKKRCLIYDKDKENTEHNEHTEHKDIYQEETDEEEEKENSKYCYRLTGILSHHGDNPNAGHYVADVYHHIPRRWYHYDDECVELVREDEILDESRERSGYLFVYTYRPLYDELVTKPRDGS